MKFVKMHGAGNDFVLIDGRGDERPWPQLAVQLCDRHFGIGADGLLVVCPSAVADIRMRMFNPDGSEAEMCGNGIRAFTKWVVEEHAVPAAGDVLTVETRAGVRSCRFFKDGGLVRRVQVSMGRPLLEGNEIGVAVEALAPITDLALDLPSGRILVTCVSMGNPHALQLISSDPFDYPMAEIGPTVEHHSLFPHGANFHAVRVVDRSHVEVRSWERGAGLTLACGTGVCAAVVAARLHGLVDGSVEVKAAGGVLFVDWDGEGEVLMSGPAVRVFAGELLNN